VGYQQQQQQQEGWELAAPNGAWVQLALRRHLDSMDMLGCQLQKQQQQQQQGRAAATRHGDQQVLPIQCTNLDSTRNRSHQHPRQQQQQGLAAAVEQWQSTCHAVPACSQTTACCLMAWPVMFWVAVQQG
jgi:hypothetical protein